MLNRQRKIRFYVWGVEGGVIGRLVVIDSYQVPQATHALHEPQERARCGKIFNLG